MRRAAPAEPTTYSPVPPPEVVRHAEFRSSPDRDAAGCPGDSEAAMQARRPRSVMSWTTVTHPRSVSPYPKALRRRPCSLGPLASDTSGAARSVLGIVWSPTCSSSRWGPAD